MAISITFIAMLSDVVGKVFLLLNRISFRARLVIVTSYKSTCLVLPPAHGGLSLEEEVVPIQMYRRWSRWLLIPQSLVFDHSTHILF